MPKKLYKKSPHHNLPLAKKSFLKRLSLLTPRNIMIFIIALMSCTGASALYIQNSYKSAPKLITSAPTETNLIPVVSKPQQSIKQSSTEATTSAPDKTTQAKAATTSTPNQPNNSKSYEANIEYIKTYQITCINPMQDLTTTVSTAQIRENQSVIAGEQDRTYQIGTDAWIKSYNNNEYMYDSSLESSWNYYISGINSLKQTVPGCAAAASYKPYSYHYLVDDSGSNYVPYTLGSSRSQYP